MGKIGDIWIRLGFKSDGVKEGLDRAVNDTEKSTKKIKDSFDKLHTVGTAIGTALGNVIGKALTSLMDMTKKLGDLAKQAFNDAIENSQKLSDSFARTTARMDGAWKAFITSVTSFSWENLGARIRSAMSASAELYDIRDRQFEVDNATKLRLSQTQQERLDLEEIIRSTASSKTEKLDAISRYRKILGPIRENAEKQASDLLRATIDSFNSAPGTSFTAKQVRDALIEMGNVGELSDIMSRAGYHTERRMQAGVGTMTGVSGGFSPMSLERVNNLTDEELKKLQEASARIGVDLRKFAEVYNEMNGDKSIQTLVDAFLGFDNAANSLQSEMKRFDIMEKNLNAPDKKKKKEERPEWGDMLPAMNREFMTTVEVMNQLDTVTAEWLARFGKDRPDEYLAFLEEITAATQEAAEAIEDAIIDGIGDSLQYLTDALFGLEELNGAQLFGALLSPLADACVQIGKAIMATGLASEAFQKSLTNPYAAIAAGAALMAVGAAAKSAISSSIGSVTGAYPQTGADSTSTASTPYSGELTINVTGNIQGDTIAITGQRAINNWNR